MKYKYKIYLCMLNTYFKYRYLKYCTSDSPPVAKPTVSQHKARTAEMEQTYRVRKPVTFQQFTTYTMLKNFCGHKMNYHNCHPANMQSNNKSHTLNE